MSDTAPSAREPKAPKPTRMEPPVGDASKGFWDATREKKLVLQWCKPCNEVIHYPRAVCPSCLGADLEWRPSSGEGDVHTFSVMHKQANPFLTPPYTVALVSLEGGARMMTNIVNCDPGKVVVGMKVKVSWEPMSDGRHLPLFEPAE